jgi:murein DD-endopeptidase MepM/ murein hydrolase activator NlpD
MAKEDAMRVQPPLKTMRLRTEELRSALGATYGMVRDDGKKAHQGWDLDAIEGTPCYAITDGTVIDVGKHAQFGNYVVLQFSKSGKSDRSGPDTMFAYYAHLGVAKVWIGQDVRAGDLIGLTGTTGNAAGGPPHLHFEVRNVSVSSPGLGLTGRVDPGSVLGYHYYSSQ